MRKYFYCLFFISTYQFSTAQNVILRDGLKPEVPKYIDLRSGKISSSGESQPYSSVAEANSSIVPGQRCIGLTVNVNDNGIQKEFWYQGGTNDANLVEKTWDMTVPNAKIRQVKFEYNVMDFLQPSSPIRTLNKLWIGNFTSHPNKDANGTSVGSHQDNALVNITDYASHGGENAQLLAMSTGDPVNDRRNGWTFMNYTDALGYVIPTMETYSLGGFGYEHRAYVDDWSWPDPTAYAAVCISPINTTPNAPQQKFLYRPLFGIAGGRQGYEFVVSADGAISTKPPSAIGTTNSGASKIKFGKLVTGQTVTITTDRFLEVEVDGQIVKLAIVQ
jgi:hypothetical protein